MKSIFTGFCFGAFLVILAIGSPGNLDYVKANAEARWKELGFEVVGYDGYQWGFWGYNTYGGAKVWYVLKKTDDNGITYGGYLKRWGDEIHIYEIRAYDAIKPKR